MSYPQKNSEKYRFVEPTTMREAKQRLREVTTNIMNVEKHLGDRRRENTMNEDEYGRWREKAKSSKIFMVTEQQLLKDFILERRRQLDAKRIGIWPYNDPRTIIQRVISEGRKALDGKSNELPAVLDAADLFLTHDA